MGKIVEAFNKAFFHTASIKKSLMLFLVLVFCSIIFFFFRLLADYVPFWLKWPLLGMPLFISFALVMGTAGILMRFYANEETMQEPPKKIFFRSWDFFLTAAYPALLLFLVFILLWFGNLLFLLLKALPFFGVFFGVVLAAGSYILNFLSLLLCIALVGFTFYILPRISTSHTYPLKDALQKFQQNPFVSLLLFFLAFFPLWVVWKIASFAVFFTHDFFSFQNAPLLTLMQDFFIAIPLLAILTLPMHFFFNFAVEANQLQIIEDEKLH